MFESMLCDEERPQVALTGIIPNLGIWFGKGMDI